VAGGALDDAVAGFSIGEQGVEAALGVVLRVDDAADELVGGGVNELLFANDRNVVKADAGGQWSEWGVWIVNR
jgi:hypothetical protein